MDTPKQSEYLFELIHSLGKNEKRYFHLYSNRHQIKGKNKYLILFDLIARQDEYDEKEIKRQFKPYYKTENEFSVIKNYLHESILKALSQHHISRASAETIIYNLLTNTEILYEKGLYHQALKTVKKARKIAEKNEKLSLEIKILEWTDKILNKMDASNPKEFYAQLESVIGKQQNLLQYKITLDKVYDRILMHGKARSETDVKAIEQLLSVALFKDESQAITIESKFLYHKILGLYHYYLNNPEDSFVHNRKAYEMLFGQARFLMSDNDVYISCMNNLIISCFETRRYELAEQYLNDFKDFYDQIKQQNDKLSAFFAIYMHRFALNTSGKGKVSYSELIDRFEKDFAKHKKYISLMRKHMLNYNVSVLYFVNGEFKKALRWLNKILLESKKLNERQDFNQHLQLYQLIIHFEMKNYDYLPYLLRSFKRNFPKRTFAGEYRFAQILEHALMLSDKEQKAFFAEAIIPFEQLLTEKNETEKWKNIYAVTYDWLKSKALGKKLSAIEP